MWRVNIIDISAIHQSMFAGCRSVGHLFDRPIHVRRLHDVEPLEGLGMMPPSQLSRVVVSKALRCVPYPLLGENTLVLSDSLILSPDEDGNLSLMFRHAPQPSSPVSCQGVCSRCKQHGKAEYECPQCWELQKSVARCQGNGAVAGSVVFLSTPLKSVALSATFLFPGSTR
jgi:hypothetical protein